MCSLQASTKFMGVQAVSYVDGDPQRLCSGASQIHMGVNAYFFFGTHIKLYYITSHYQL